MTQPPLKARIEVFRPGTFKPMAGAAITYSAADLKAIADGYDPETAPAPVVVGHPDTDAPAFGWIEKLEYDPAAERLFATLHEIEPQFADLVKAGRFKKVSMAFFSPDSAHNPVPGGWYPKHVGFLGAAAPAVAGLRNAAFAAPADAVFTAEFGLGEEVAGIFRAFRDFLIDKFSLEEAEKALPSWRIDWMEQADPKPSSFAAPPAPQPDPKKEDPAVTQQPDPVFATREANLKKREDDLAKREAAAAHGDNVNFAEGLVTAGKLLPASKDKVVAILDALPGTASVAFSEGGDKITPAAALREVLDAQPKVVSFGEADLGQDPGKGKGKAPAFAADGQEVDPEGLITHQQALEYQRLHPATSYIDAVRAVTA